VQSTTSAETASYTCATSDGAYLTTAALRQPFVAAVDDRFGRSPLLDHRLPGSGPSPAAIRDWVGARLRGWIAEAAVDGPDRAAEDAIARSLGYSIGKLPLVPLVGPVVEHNPGVLEVYQTNTVYRSVAGASDFMADLAADAKLAETTVVTTDGRAEPEGIPVHLSGGDEDVAYEMPGYLGPDGATEAFFNFAVRLGRFVVQLSVQSGYGWTVPQAIAVLDRATAQLARSCGVATPRFTAG